MWNAPVGGGALKLGLVMGDLRGILGASRRTLTGRPVFNESTSTVVWYDSTKPGATRLPIFLVAGSGLALLMPSDLSAETAS
jgi:hypothetical protein